MNEEHLITREHLEAIGATTEGDVSALLTHLNETLEERVGVAISELLDEEKLKELVELQDKADDKVVGEWINDNVPDLQQIAEDERDILLGELADNASQL